MRTSQLIVSIVATIALLNTSCARHHHGRPMETHTPAISEVVPQVKELVEQHVKDPEKAKQVQALIKGIVEEVRLSGQETRGFHEQLYGLNANYDAAPEQFTKILDEVNNTRMASASRILSTRFKIKDLLTREEWKNLNEAMAKVRNRYTRGEGS